MNTTETNIRLPQRHEQSKQVNDTNPSQWLPQLASIGDNKLAQSQKRRPLRTKYNEHKKSTPVLYGQMSTQTIQNTQTNNASINVCSTNPTAYETTSS